MDPGLFFDLLRQQTNTCSLKLKSLQVEVRN